MSIGDGRVISNFITSALNNDNLIINGKGIQTRSFCYIDDTINAILKASESKYFGPFNIGNPNEISINDLAKRIISLTNSKSDIFFEKLPEDDPLQRRPDISRAEEMLHWRPSIHLEEGLKNTINYFNS